MTHPVKIVAGNWKMHGSKASVAQLCQSIAAVGTGVKTIVLVPYPFLSMVSEWLAGSSVALGAQLVSMHQSGAYTGEVSADMLAEFGCQYVLVGHSERRQLHHETNADIAEQFARAQQAKIVPILCVGETLAEREAEQTFSVIAEQLTSVIDCVGMDAFSSAVIAYEPVWAIGTGKSATPEQAQDVHHAIRELVAKYDAGAAQGLSILYGGSVKPENAAALFAQRDIDGALVGGASLDAESFINIIQASC